MKRRYTIMEENIGETQVKLNQALLVANEVPLLVTHKNDSTIHVTPSNKTTWDGAVTDIGTKTNLLTTDKSNLVGAVNELFTNANNGKTAVASAITAKGVTASPTDAFAVLASKIGQINTGKKWKKGSFTATSETHSITGLGFLPSELLYYMTSRVSGVEVQSSIGVAVSSGTIFNYGALKNNVVFRFNNAASYSMRDEVARFSNGSISNIACYQGVIYDWIAYE